MKKQHVNLFYIDSKGEVQIVPKVKRRGTIRYKERADKMMKDFFKDKQTVFGTIESPQV